MGSTSRCSVITTGFYHGFTTSAPLFLRGDPLHIGPAPLVYGNPVLIFHLGGRIAPWYNWRVPDLARKSGEV
jgi:hypothetical protein